MALPIDLQVTFTKANEFAENIGRNNAALEAGKHTATEKMHQNSVETNNRVNKAEKYEEDSTKVNAETGERKKDFAQNKGKRNPNQNEEETIGEYKRAMKEAGTGTIIDIID